MSKNIGEVSIKIKAEVDKKQADQEIKKLENSNPKIKVDANVASAQTKIKNLLKNEKKTIPIDGDDKPIGGILEGLKNKFSSMASFGKIAMGGFIGAIVTGLQSALQIASAITEKIFEIGSSLMKAGNEARNTEISFQKMMKDAEKGSEMYNKLSDFAATTPFGDGVMQTGRMLLGSFNLHIGIVLL